MTNFFPKFVFSEKRRKISLSPHKNNSSFSLCIIITHHHRGATLSLFHEEVKEEEDSKEFVNVRRASETASKSAARRVMFALGRYEHFIHLFFCFFLREVCFSLRVWEKSTRFRYTFFMLRCARFVRFCYAM